MHRFRTTLNLWAAGLQGAYYAILGVWPLISIRSFEAVTGPKTDHLPTGDPADHWLVYCVGLLITLSGIVLLIGVSRRSVTFELMVLGVGTAVVLGGIDVVYALRGTISSIYLLDAAVEAVLALVWLFTYPALGTRQA